MSDEPINFTIRVHDNRMGFGEWRLDWLPEAMLEELVRQVAAEQAARAVIREQWHRGNVAELEAQVHRQAGIVRELLRQIRGAQRIVRLVTGATPEPEIDP